MLDNVDGGIPPFFSPWVAPPPPSSFMSNVLSNLLPPPSLPNFNVQFLPEQKPPPPPTQAPLGELTL